LGAPKAITAMAHRLARLVYRMLKYGQQYLDKGSEFYEHRYRQQQIQFLTKKAAQLGLKIAPTRPLKLSSWRAKALSRTKISCAAPEHRVARQRG
jgi:hypothetical protein